MWKQLVDPHGWYTLLSRDIITRQHLGVVVKSRKHFPVVSICSKHALLRIRCVIILVTLGDFQILSKCSLRE